MDYLRVLWMLFVAVCVMSMLNLLMDIATSLRAMQRREFTNGLGMALDRIAQAIEKSTQAFLNARRP